MKDKTKWLVTVAGYDSFCRSPETQASKVVELDNGVTVPQWFVSNRKKSKGGQEIFYGRFNFVPEVLLGFWPVPEIDIDNRENGV